MFSYKLLPTSYKLYYVPMDHIGRHLKTLMRRSRETERGELMEYFCSRLNATRMADGYQVVTMPRMGKILEKIPTKDLYYLKRICDDAPNFSKRFWWELDPKKHDKSENSTPFDKSQYGKSRPPKR